jgi:hypothetical protein
MLKLKKSNNNLISIWEKISTRCIALGDAADFLDMGNSYVQKSVRSATHQIRHHSQSCNHTNQIKVVIQMQCTGRAVSRQPSARMNVQIESCKRKGSLTKRTRSAQSIFINFFFVASCLRGSVFFITNLLPIPLPAAPLQAYQRRRS